MEILIVAFVKSDNRKDGRRGHENDAPKVHYELQLTEGKIFQVLSKKIGDKYQNKTEVRKFFERELEILYAE